MKDNYIHVCFVIDESGSMASSVSDVIGGFENTINEQKNVEHGQCSISLYKFSDEVIEVYVGKDIKDVEPLKSAENKLASYMSERYSDVNNYSPGGCTAMFDGIGRAIDNIGKWLSDMPEDERPSKNLIIIMTDGEENASHTYSAEKVKSLIKEQEEKYNWTFIYMGTDITTRDYANNIGIQRQAYSSRADVALNYNLVSDLASSFRCMSHSSLRCCSWEDEVNRAVDAMTTEYEVKTGNKM